MTKIIIFLCLVTGGYSASYPRYSESTPGYSGYTSYGNNPSTLSTLYNNYKTNYNNDVVPFPDQGTRYPNTLNTGYASTYTNYGSGNSNGYSNGYSNSYSNGYSTPRPNGAYNSYSTPGYGYNSYSTPNSGYSSYGTNSPSYGAGYKYNSISPGGSSFGGGYSSYERPLMSNRGEYCVNRAPQNEIWIDSLYGIWYGVEYIDHIGGFTRIDYSDDCFMIHIAEPRNEPSTEGVAYHAQHIQAKFKQDYRHLHLLWEEGAKNVEYALYFRNDSVGYWNAYNKQNGSLASHPSYQQFTGTIQVLKAVNDHLLLSFCQEQEKGQQAQLYSVLLTRGQEPMPRWQIESVHTLLQNKQLSVASRRMVCGNSSAHRTTVGLVMSVLACVWACLLSKA